MAISVTTTATNCFAAPKMRSNYLYCFDSLFVVPMSILWHYRSAHIKRWERWHEVNNDEWGWCLKSESNNCIVDSFKVDDYNTPDMLSATITTTTEFQI